MALRSNSTDHRSSQGLGGPVLVLVINSGSSSLKYQVRDVEAGSVLAEGLVEKIGMGNGGEGDGQLEGPARPCGGAGTGGRGDPRRAGRPGARRRGAPGGARRGALRRARAGRQRDHPRHRTAQPAGAPAQPGERAGHPRDLEEVAGHAAGGRVRHRLPPHPARARLALRRAGRALHQPRDPPLRLPRHLARIRRAPGRGAAGRPGGRVRRRHRPPGQRRLRHGDPRRHSPWTPPWASPRWRAW